MPETAVFSDHNRVLSIPNAELRHRGQYECSVSRENGLSASGMVQVPIEGNHVLYESSRFAEHSTICAVPYPCAFMFMSIGDQPHLTYKTVFSGLQ